jgi:biopolymer transport protein TolR
MIELPQRHRPSVDAHINIVPYIDVMLVLLVIFMMTTPIIEQGIEVELPIASEADIIESIDEARSVIIVYKNGDYAINSFGDDEQKYQISSIESIVSELTARRDAYPNILAIIQGDKDTSYGQVVSLWNLLKNSGVTGVIMSVDSPDGL